MEDEAPSGTLRTGSGIGRSARLSNASDTTRTRQGDPLLEIKIRGYTFGLMVTIVGLGLYSYYVRELLAALTLFSADFFFLALLGLGALLVWCASMQVANWGRPVSRSMTAFSRRLIAAYARP